MDLRKKFWGLADAVQGPAIWAGNKAELAEKNSYRMRLRILEFSAEELSLLLEQCRRNKASLTGLLHGVFVAAIARWVPEAECFRALTPLSLRYCTGSDKKQVMSVEIDDLWCTYDKGTLSAVRQLPDHRPSDLTAVWNVGKIFKACLAKSRRQIPWDMPHAFPGYFDPRAM